MQVAVYVYGDDHQGSVNETLDAVTEHNRSDGSGAPKVRIHSVAFPVYYEVTDELLSAAGYAALMRELSQRNGGSFIGLPAGQ